MKRRAFIGGMAAILASRRAPAFCVAMRNGMMRPSAAPTPPLPYDAEVEYLESTGTQYINTGIPGGPDLLFTCRFKRSNVTSSTSKLIYGALTNTRNVVGLGGVNSSGFFTWNPNTTVQNSGIVADVDWHNSVMSTVVGNKYLSIDGAIATSTNTTSDSGSRPIFVFARNPYTDEGSIQHTDCQVSSFSITRASDSTLLIDLISVRFTNEQGVSEGTMYDRVSGALFRNAGTGAFVIGPDKS